MQCLKREFSCLKGFRDLNFVLGKPQAIVADQQEKAHDMSFEPVQPNPSEPQFRSSSVYNPLMMDTVLQHATPVTESVSQFLLPHPKLGYNPLAFEQDREKQQLEVEMSNKERSFASRQVSKECFLGLSTGSAESLIRTQEAIEMQVSSTSGVPTASLLFPYFYEVCDFSKSSGKFSLGK